MKNLVKTYLSTFYHGFRDWSTNRKIIVIESDDWGSIRMPDRRTYDLLLKRGYPLDSRPFERFDTIASEEDFDKLLSVLKNYKDKNGRHPVITANVITGNPDFDKIKNSFYEEFYVEDFTTTLQRYGRSTLDTWLEAINSGMFFPQYHGREHLNVFSWLNELQNQNNEEIEGFQNGLMGIPLKKTPELGNQHQAAFNCNTSNGRVKEYLKESITDGMNRFKNSFGFSSKSFIAPVYTWNGFVESCISNIGVKVLQGARYQSLPLSSKKIRHHIGERSPKFTFLIRNAFFEPSTIIRINQRGKVLKHLIDRTNALFALNRPVIVSSHRINYIGTLDLENRVANLELLRTYLSYILKKYPDVEFLTTLELAKIINDEDSHT